MFCANCATEMSENATACPKCGEPTAKSTEGKVTGLLGVGIFLFPCLFAWFTLKKGFSTTARVVSFGWLAWCVLCNFLFLSVLATAATQ